ncbi:eukaryotic translation initiation factor 2D [Clupea harengus]|uniref:Eukaryotic translation initiation factor 2D n=1 Tax=Clupea harengus TaxID=7950 RepID=A0A6P3W6A4_CLUHA|nr:eukaryotic translation initiation factor 2D [Clupea harengus]
MFEKAFRVKSNTVIKGSDRRKLRTEIAAAFPALSTDELSELVPNKDELNVVKVYAHKGDAVTFYVLHKNPIFFQLEKQIYPTVYALWRCPEMLPTLITWPAVIQKLAGGADLMLPGVVVPPCGLPEVARGNCCAIMAVGNRAPVAVGTVNMSNLDMMSSGMKGKGVNVLHTYMDQLWAFGDKSVPPTITATGDKDASEEMLEGDGSGEEEGTGEEVEQEDGEGEPYPVSERNGLTVINSTCPNIKELSLAEREEEQADEEEEQGDDDGEHDSRSPQEQMDELLLQCFFQALKTKVKKSELPLLTSTFLRVHMVSCCPGGKHLDIKKSSYKKLSKFLQCMQKEHHLVQVKELSKGVESIVGVEWKHRELRSFITPEDCGPADAPNEAAVGGEVQYLPPEITMMYMVTARLEPLFRDAQKRKGSAVQPAEMRTIITEYVKRNELVDENNQNFVSINPALCDCLLEKSEYHEVSKLKWDELFTRTLGKMQHCHQIQFPGQRAVVKKGAVEPIDISVSSRGSNKKVTIIKNLEAFGLDPAVVSAALQHRVQASSALHAVPGSKDRVMVQIQGNQIQHVGKMLLDNYRIPRQYIEGLDKAPKPGKKK